MKSQNNGLFTTVSGALATVRACNFCRYADTLRTGQRDAGRGFGLREGNKARGRMIEHMKAAHPDAYRAWLVAQRKSTP